MKSLAPFGMTMSAATAQVRRDVNSQRKRGVQDAIAVTANCKRAHDSLTRPGAIERSASALLRDGLCGRLDRITIVQEIWVTDITLDNNGIKLAASVYGPADGEPILLLHGMSLSRDTWDEVVEQLDDRFHETCIMEPMG